MEYNLLLRKYDEVCNMFIDGLIPYNLFVEIENIYLNRYKLFLINLN